MFLDDPDSFTVYPSITLPEDGSPPLHHDDVLAMAFCPPNILATSSYDGDVVLCNLYSGHILHRLRPYSFDEGSARANRSIDKVLFLTERMQLQEAATLVTSGADGIIRWWNVEEGYLMWETDGTHGRREGVFSMCANAANTVLVTADALGWVTVWDISQTCLDVRSPRVMPVLHSFRAHARSIVNLDLVEGFDMLVTASTDGTARMYTFAGIFVGTFGQPALWDLGNPATSPTPTTPKTPSAYAESQTSSPLNPAATCAPGGGMGDPTTLGRLSREGSRSGSDAGFASSSGNLPPLDLAPGGRTASFLDVHNPARRETDPQLQPPGASASMAAMGTLLPQLVPPRAAPRTADLLRRDYSTWYATTLFARGLRTRAPGRRQEGVAAASAARTAACAVGEARTAGLRIYHRLQPQELADVDGLIQMSGFKGKAAGDAVGLKSGAGSGVAPVGGKGAVVG
ncbi:WD40-repeat-containing domain protein [Blyttiomyces helicus]|uniref:WD40-repeat-containing domain protein n=1 Tax=Blyttiomyces helicus TaxID=388810 RepID=A0A4P9WBS7_9FUNG|nr:WD40-repeat-containing domain protein [Blyttiomyces helicus]|eukprot:RKO89075.1 WD40-repeat-containing domain protein [Blyttiomyces helicus]